MPKTFNVGVIGAGRIGRLHIENLVHHIPNAKVKIVADINITEQLAQWANEIGISNISDNPNTIFEDPVIDAVLIASSTDTHASFIQKAAKAKKHIFCEKPIDINIVEIEKSLKVVKNNDVKFMVGFNRRYDENFRRVYEVVDSGKIGIPHIIKITSRDPAPPPIEYIKVSGGIFIDMTIHDWDMARFLAQSDVEEIYTKGAVLIAPEIGDAGDIDTVIAVLKFKNGALGIIDNSRQAVYGYDQRVEVFGSKGCVKADNQPKNTVQIYTENNIKKDKIPYFFLERYKSSYINELRTFFTALKENKNPSPDGRDGLQSILIAKAAQKSYQKNRPVKLIEIKQ
jgi:myo-inositol 2-dehydrogenase/D-chiro-inositol 1-dehydrogenase